jgi:peptide/nickel transport system ATP-binding protein
LNRAHGIAVVYITHDIMTAYHVADTICVLYRGHLVDTGNAAEVIRSPQHPYTQLPVSSIPWPEPGRRRGKGVERTVPRNGSGPEDTGCAFAGRCPRVTAECTRVVPPLQRSVPAGAAACHLLGHAAPLGADELAELLDGA